MFAKTSSKSSRNRHLIRVGDLRLSQHCWGQVEQTIQLHVDEAKRAYHHKHNTLREIETILGKTSLSNRILKRKKGSAVVFWKGIYCTKGNCYKRGLVYKFKISPSLLSRLHLEETWCVVQPTGQWRSQKEIMLTDTQKKSWKKKKKKKKKKKNLHRTASKIGATLKGKNLLPEGANSFFYE